MRGGGICRAIICFWRRSGRNFRGGAYNAGLSHGVTGVLGFFAQAGLQGVEVPGQRELGAASPHGWNRSGKTTGGRQIFAEGEEEILPVVDSWCYGAPGIARVLYLSGKWLGDKSMQERALETFHSVVVRQNLNNPAFCHGWSGLLVTTLLMAKESRSTRLHEALRPIEQKIIEFYPTGFERPGLLEGRAGILLSLSTLSTHNTSWTLPFLI